MSRIAYDPVKDRFAAIIRDNRFLRTTFYKLLDLFFLRSWYIRRLLRKYTVSLEKEDEWKLLDAGCGFGQYDRFILQQFPAVEITAVDVKNTYLADCRYYFRDEIARGDIRFEKADLLDLHYSSIFDISICVDVLEHITEDVQVMKNIHQVLKSGGYFIMHSPSIYSEEDAGTEESFVDEHARTGYSKQELDEKLRLANFTPVEIAYTYGKKGHLAWQLLIKYPMLWMNKMKLWALPLMAVYYIFTLPVGLLLMKFDMSETNKKGTGIYAVAQKK
jgi:SAM-dependent methyltransferase